ncbi:uncharacterized protein HMPREF1541_04790 [Cyphellophora europaea CBS 101466]|uniref:Rhodopsin domain-containing protein n=1 Tax=Cyphellophora europaea (strain CBS 101466) TaxID=1220924 RepID=W2RXL4_CYPE1|nr:uncharacterized protein HMPREF1541_04790 [Cyphellophora europaea CBS 101466]ETN40513.1 hypothetical protein HMPREF1541_04790 [Cyphellophora europaea CBS 101466]
MSSFIVESWTWCAVTLCMVIARFVSRIWHFRSVKKLMVEDWLMAFLTGLYIVLIAFLNVDLNVSTNLINPADMIELTPQEISRRTYGSKTVLLVEQSMCAIQWGTKVCLLLLFWRITHNLRQHLAVKLVAAYVVTTYCVMFILYFGVWCRPFSDYWKVPTDNVQCTTALNHLITNLVFNLSSDVMIMAIPIPLLLKQQLPWKKKLLMVFPFTLGLFTMVCAILSKYSSFHDPFAVAWVYWYCREASTTMIVSNMPYSWALIRRIFHLRSFLGDSTQNDLQDSNVRQITGQTVRSRTNGSMQRSRKRSWLWTKTMPTSDKTMTTDSQNEMVTRARTNTEDGKTDPLDRSSSDTSAFGSPLKARTASAADPIDRIYNLDDDELVAPDPTRRGYRPD